MIKAIVFDCFGVLVGKGFWDVYDAAGGDSKKDTEFIEIMLQQANSGTITNDEFSSTIADKIGISIANYQKIVEREEQPNQLLFDYIKNTLKPNYKIALLSNVNSGVIEQKIPTQLRAVFDEEIISAEVGYQKPDEKIFELTAAKLNVNYEEMIFTDDLQKYLTSATELGINTILYKDFAAFKTELERLLNKLAR